MAQKDTEVEKVQDPGASENALVIETDLQDTDDFDDDASDGGELSGMGDTGVVVRRTSERTDSAGCAERPSSRTHELPHTATSSDGKPQWLTPIQKR